MFKKIDRISVKVTTFCNMDCTYCHQLKMDKDKPEAFAYYDELKAFLSKCKMAGRVKATITGGEISLRLRDLVQCDNALNSIGNAVYAPNIVTNGSNLKGIIGLIRKGVLRADSVTLSWDGIHSCSKTRHSKNHAYNDSFFNKNIETLGRLGYGDAVSVVCAVTPANVEDLHASLLFALDAGVRNFTYYLVHEGNYDDLQFLSEFERQLRLMAREFVERYDTNRFAFYNLQNLYARRMHKGDFLSSITCKKLGRTLHFDTEGDIYGCIYFGDHRALQLGSLLDGGVYPDRLEEFSEDFLQAPSCDFGSCGMVNCFECPASNYVSLGSMQEKRCHACAIRRIENRVLDGVLAHIDISGYDKATFWNDHDADSENHMLAKRFDINSIGLPLATSEAHKKECRPIESENAGRIAKWL